MTVRVLVVFCLLGFLSGARGAEQPRETKHLPGVALAQGITEITGVAISPLLGVSAVGAWRYFQTPEEARAALPWFCQPWAWGTGLAVLSLCFLKDTAGAAAPGILKKPFDLAELFEDKASALVASAAFVPLVAGEMVEAFQREFPVFQGAIGTGAAVPVDMLWLLVPLSVAAFLAVWLCSHVINVLIVLSPSSMLDTVLKLMRSGLLAAVLLFWWIAPWLAAMFCLLLLAVAVRLAPAAFRWMVFGAGFAGDLLLAAFGGRRAEPGRPHVFTTGGFREVPARTRGRLELGKGGKVVFRYRPWLVLPKREARLPDGAFYVSKGLLSPGLHHRAPGETGAEEMFVFLPRYRGRERSVAEELGLAGVREHALARGWTAVRGWLRDLVLWRKAPQGSR